MKDTVDSVLATLQGVLPEQRPMPLHEPTFTGHEWERVKDCLDSGWVSSVGAYVERFESSISEYTGIPHAIATVNGTSALHTCLVLAGVEQGDEVLLPALTFVGSANPVASMGAIPHFVDCERNTLGVCPHTLAGYLERIAELRNGCCYNRETGRRIRALVVVHVLGHIGNMRLLAEIAERHDLELIEDAAEALGSWRDGQHAGSWSRLSALSFNGNKIVTTGGGGAVLTNDAELAQRARHLTTTAKKPHPWTLEHDLVGYNYRMPNLNAALGLAQLEQLPSLVAAKRALANRYQSAFKDSFEAAAFHEPQECHSNYWLNLLLIGPSSAREPLLQAAHESGLQLRPFWTPLNRLPMYKTSPSMPLPVANELFSHGVCLPSSATLHSAGKDAQ